MNTKRTPLFLMANLGSEVKRALQFKEARDTARCHSSVSRAESIIKQLLDMTATRSRKDEFVMLREVIVGIDSETARRAVSSGPLMEYFMPFVLRYARQNLA